MLVRVWLIMSLLYNNLINQCKTIGRLLNMFPWTRSRLIKKITPQLAALITKFESYNGRIPVELSRDTYIIGYLCATGNALLSVEYEKPMAPEDNSIIVMTCVKNAFGEMLNDYFVINNAVKIQDEKYVRGVRAALETMEVLKNGGDASILFKVHFINYIKGNYL